MTMTPNMYVLITVYGGVINDVLLFTNKYAAVSTGRAFKKEAFTAGEDEIKVFHAGECVWSAEPAG